MTNPNCISQYCSEGCCNMDGYCPNIYSSYYSENTCYYYYSTYNNDDYYYNYQSSSSSPLSAGTIVSIVIPCLFFIGIIMLIAFLCYRKHNQTKVIPPVTNIYGNPDVVTYGTANQLNPTGQANYLGNNMPYYEPNPNNLQPYQLGYQQNPSADQYNPYANNNIASFNHNSWNSNNVGSQSYNAHKIDGQF